MKVEDLAAIRTGYELSGMLPALQQEVEAMQKTIVNNVLSAISEGKLTPDLAQQKWLEYAAAVRMLQRFQQKVRFGTSQGEANTLTFDGQSVKN